jgi:lysophospholipase L1-like esterase
MAVDIIARGLASAEVARQKRLRVLNTLRATIGRAGAQPLELAAVLPTIGASTATTGIATGTTWQVSSNAVPLHAAKYTFHGALWKNTSTSYPNGEFYRGEAFHQGNGSDPLFGPGYGGRVRFALEAPSFEIYVQTALPGNGNGFRLKVDGKYVRQGTLGLDATNGAVRFIPVTWGDGSAVHRKVRYYELEFGAVGGFFGIRTTNLYKPSPWPQPDGLRVLIHGDSMVSTIVDSGDRDAALLPALGTLLGDLIGQSDCWASGTGGAGWLAPALHNQSWFNDRVAIDVVAPAPDVIVELGGANDAGVNPSLAAQQTVVQAWLDTVLAARPDTIVFMTGPILASNPGTAHSTIMAAKAAAATSYPRNVAFIDNLTDPYVFGTGRQTTLTGDGNRDWVAGSDGAHPTMEGHRYLASRIARGVARAIPGLIAAQS